MGRAQLNLLGEFECCDAAGAPQSFPTRKIRALLAYLAMTSGRRHRRDKLAGLLWGNGRKRKRAPISANRSHVSERAYRRRLERVWPPLRATSPYGRRA